LSCEFFDGCGAGCEWPRLGQGSRWRDDEIGAKQTADCKQFYASALQRIHSLLPLNHLRRRFRVDLKEQIFKARAKSPTVCPPKFVDLEFTGKFCASEEWLFREVSESID
jgi:hypothetical protein